MKKGQDSITISDRHNDRGIKLANRNWLDEAVKEFRRALDLDPQAGHVHDNLATVYARKGMHREALTEYLTALRLEPANPTTHYNLACFLAAHGTDLSISEYREAINLEYDYPDAHSALAMSYADVGLIPEAIQEYQTAIKLDPDDLASRHELANLLMETDDQAGAIKNLLMVVQKDPRAFEAHIDLGICFASQGFYEEAEKAFKQAHALKPQEVVANYHLAALNASWATQLKPHARRQAANRLRAGLPYLATAVQLEPTKVRRWVEDDHLFDGVRTDPRVKAILEG